MKLRNFTAVIRGFAIDSRVWELFTKLCGAKLEQAWELASESVANDKDLDIERAMADAIDTYKLPNVAKGAADV